MLDQQLDLFSYASVGPRSPMPRCTETRPAAADLKDAALIAAIPESSLAVSSELAAEAGRRGLVAAVPALAALCRRFAGFGIERMVPEQVAALQALAAIGGREAADAVAHMIERGSVQGPGLQAAVAAAARLHATLSVDVLQTLLRHPTPAIRADACRCARPVPGLIAVLIDLLGDHDRAAASSAACALARMGRTEARAALRELLCRAPSADVIDAVSAVADEECVILLGRIARSRTGPRSGWRW